MLEADVETVAAIERAVHAHPWSHGNFVDSLASGYDCWIVECDGVIAGYIVGVIAAGEAHLLNLSVAPAWQRRGIGIELTRYFVELARLEGAEKLFLEVRPSNRPARALYRAVGFRRIGVRRGYYPAGEDREDAIVMELVLQ